MNAKRLMSLMVGATLFVSMPMGTSAWAAAKAGDAAPTFSVTDAEGKTRKLEDFKGKYVVLEWHNQGCPYVKKHYDTGNMQKLQKEWTDKGVVWLSVISSAPGKEGYVTADEAKSYMKDKKAANTAVLLDSSGEMGKAYGAKTTPHMFVINPKGVVIYNGAMDDQPNTDADAVPRAKNYVSEALKASMAGKKVAKASNRPYGCSVKYPN